MGNMRSSVLGEGVSLSPASRGKAALEELFSSEEEAELWERWGTWRLRCCWARLSGSSGGRHGECVSVFSPTTLPKEKHTFGLATVDTTTHTFFSVSVCDIQYFVPHAYTLYFIGS